MGDFDGLEETGFGALRVCLRAPERDLTIDTVQIGGPEPLARSLDEREGVLKRGFGACDLARLWCMDTLTPSREVIVLEVR